LRSLRVLFYFGLVGLCAGAPPAQAQEGAFAFEIRGGASLPVSSFRSGEEGWAGEMREGASFDMGFTFPAPGPFGILLGFGQRRFSCEGQLCVQGGDWISTGFDVALRLVIGRSRVRPWLKGGLHTHRLEGTVLGDAGEANDTRSDGGAGFEAGGGVLIAIGERTSLSPGLRYGWAEVPFPTRSDLRLRYMVADLGLVVGF